MYDAMMVQPMREELTNAGIQELRTPEEVDAHFKNHTGTTVLYINSVCGCAAGNGRPGVIASLNTDIKPDNACTVFAGVDKEATEQARKYITNHEPSSPAVALFRDGEVVYFIPRLEIEGADAQMLSDCLQNAYKKYCEENIDSSVEDKFPTEYLEISVHEVHDKINAGHDFKFLDCRTPEEREKAAIEAADLVTDELVNEILNKWDKDLEIVIHCHHGRRSLQATKSLRQQGFKNVKSMQGGIHKWSEDINPDVPFYGS